MSLWGKKDQANNAPKYKIFDNSPNTGIQLYGTKIVGISAAESAASGNIAHSGWVEVKRGTGPVSNVTITAAGSGYTNGEVLLITGGTANSVYTIGTNGSGGITTLTKVKAGAGFVNNAGVVTAFKTSESGSASAGTAATVTVTLGGRANRVQTEVLVALGDMVGNNSIV